MKYFNKLKYPAPGRMSWPSAILKCAVTGLGIYYLLSFLYVAVHHLGYPFELEWMEGGMLDHVQRMASGQSMYVRPTLEFVPFTYTPLYFLVSTLMAKLLGAHLWVLRLLTILATLANMGLLYQWAYRETGSHRMGWIALSLFAATYSLSGSWLTLARVDSLFLLLLLGSGYALRQGKQAASAILAGTLLSLAFFCKQTGLVIALPILLYAMIYESRQRKTLFILPYVLVMMIGVTYYQISTGGWFFYYCFQVPAQHELVWWHVHHFWLDYFIQPLPIVLVLAVAAVVHPRMLKGKENAFWVFFSGAIIGGSWIAHIPVGSYNNVAIPGHALLALLTALSVSNWLKMTNSPVQKEHPLVNISGMQNLMWGLLLIQLLMLGYNPKHKTPGPEDSAAGRVLIKQLQAVNGPVWMPSSGYLAVRAGHGPSAHRCAVVDVLRMPEHRGDQGLRQQLREALQSGRFAAVVMDDDWLSADLLLQYKKTGPLISNPLDFMPITGLLTRPTWLYSLLQDHK